MTERPHPVPDAETRRFWDAIAAGRLEIQRCAACQRHVFYPRSVCPHCGRGPLQWVPASGRAAVHSFTVVHRTAPEFSAEVPFVVALVDLEEGPRMMTRLLGVQPGEVQVGMPVEVAISGDPPLPYFKPSQRR